MTSFARTEAALRIGRGEVYGGAVVRVMRDGALAYESVVGERAPGVPASTDSVFDLASLTKIFTGTALLALFERRLFALDDPIVAVIPEFDGLDPRRRLVTFRHLLVHTSGLPAHVNFRTEAGAGAIISRVCATPLSYAPGTDVVYSDLGFILLGHAIARLAGKPLDVSVSELVIEPLGLQDIGYRPGPELFDRIVCTEDDPWRGRLLRGEVHDENAWAMGGVAGHAGLFGTAAAVATLTEAYRQGGAVDGRRVLERSTALQAIGQRSASIDGQERRGLAWAMKISDESSCGRRFSMRSFGHTGYTGTSVWCDPERRLTVVLLTNRVFSSRDAEPIHRLRIAIHEAVSADAG